MSIEINIPEAFQELFIPARYKAFRGGRGSAKSHSAARALVAKVHTERPQGKPHRILCTREYQNSISDSVHRVLVDTINNGIRDDKKRSLAPYFHITRNSITSRVTGGEFIFKGLQHNVQEIKSMEGVTIAWCEEAQSMSEDSWVILDPTIREPGSEIWITYNPDQEDDPTHKRCVVDPLPDMISRKVNWRDNIYFNEVLERQRSYAESIAKRDNDWEAYDWIWEGECRKISDAQIFKRRVEIHTFDTPPGTHFEHGADWGFSQDPTCLIRCWVDRATNELYVDWEAVGYGVEIDETPQLFDVIPTARSWPIRGDDSRPETISYMRRQGFNIDAAEKWPNSVEDGVAHLLGFSKIHIHEARCPNLVREAKLYSYKVDRVTGEVLPIILDKHNHGWDAVRYALWKYIKGRGALGVWQKLAEKM